MSADFSVQRAKMVEGQLRTTDVTNIPLLEAMAQIPREEFVPGKRRALAYIDEDLEIAPASAEGPARYLMEPSPFARLVQLAGIGPGDFVLDIGCATGYSSAVLSRLASSVIALESDSALAEIAAETLSRLGYDNVAVVQGPLHKGFPSEAPYDVIFVGGAVEEIPEALFDQLKEGGRLVTVVGQGNAAMAHLYLKDSGIVSGRRSFNAAVKPLPGFERAPVFVF
jgi:protein-L-isoaspartate(D-aspartate) O-methyltransferase